MPTVTVLTPVYNEEAGLPLYVAAIKRTLLSRADVDYRVLLIDDGSSDGSWERIREISAECPAFQGLRLSRNFGSHNALAAGFEQVATDAAVILACDLQDPPETVLEFVERWKAGAQIVFGRRRSSGEGFLRTLVSRVFNRVLAFHAFPRESKFASGSFLLADRRVIECYRQMGEAQCITFALFAWTGFRQERVDYDRARRQTGRSRWTFPGMTGALYDTLIGYSRLPIQVFLSLSLFCLMCSLGIVAYALVSYAVGATRMPGWTSLVALVSALLGVQAFLLSILAEYLYRIYMQTLRRPRFFVADSTSRAP
jgi:dolichol-phosphate mannosyltransferase